MGTDSVSAASVGPNPAQSGTSKETVSTTETVPTAVNDDSNVPFSNDYILSLPSVEELNSHGVKALIFDCDGTLVHSMAYFWQGWVMVCKKWGVEFTKERYFICSLWIRSQYYTKELQVCCDLKISHLHYKIENEIK